MPITASCTNFISIIIAQIFDETYRIFRQSVKILDSDENHDYWVKTLELLLLEFFCKKLYKFMTPMTNKNLLRCTKELQDITVEISTVF